MALVITLQGEIGFAATPHPETDEGMLAFADRDTGTQIFIPTDKETALSWAAHIQRKFSGLEVVSSIPRH